MLVDVTAPLGALGLDPADGLPDRTAIEFERAVVAGNGVYVRVTGTDAESVVTALRESAAVADLELVDEGETDAIYRVTWADGPPSLFAAVTGVDGAVVAARAADDQWTLTLRFPNRNAASEFVSRYDDEPPVTIEQIHQASRLPTRELTTQQHAALRRAVDAGYFAVPRRATLGDLAEELDISDTAVSQRLRRGLATVLPGIVDPAQDSVRDSAHVRND